MNMRGIHQRNVEKVWGARYLYIKMNVEEVRGARYTLGARHLSKYAVIGFSFWY
jgi:hypothetical protein